MSIIKAMSTAQLQNMQHFLQEMESEGIVRIDVASGVVVNELSARFAEYAEQQPTVDPTPRPDRKICPVCSGLMVAYKVNASPSTIVDGEYTAVFLCGACLNEEWI